MKPNALLLSNWMTKLYAVVFGFSIWLIVSQSHIVSITKTVSLSFYNQPKNTQVYAPETVTISTFGPKQNLTQTFGAEYAVHINLSNYPLGTHQIELSQQDLFLPPSIKLLQLKPSMLQIKIAQ